MKLKVLDGAQMVVGSPHVGETRVFGYGSLWVKLILNV
jgi:hypothetical protein